MVLFAVAATLSMMAVAYAHPHVLPTVRTDLKFSPAGHVTAIQYTWLYDSAYSTFVGIYYAEGKTNSKELAAFAKSYSSLSEHSHFMTVNNRRMADLGPLNNPWKTGSDVAASFTILSRPRFRSIKVTS